MRCSSVCDGDVRPMTDRIPAVRVSALYHTDRQTYGDGKQFRRELQTFSQTSKILSEHNAAFSAGKCTELPPKNPRNDVIMIADVNLLSRPLIMITTASK